MLTQAMVSSKQKIRSFIGVAVAVLFIASCASNMERVDFGASANPADVLSTVQNSHAEALQTDADILDKRNFDKGVDYLIDAQNLQVKGENPGEVLNKLGYAQAFFDKAIQNSNARRESVEKILTARRAALTAGVQDFPDLTSTLSEYDHSFRRRLNELLSGSRDPALIDKMHDWYSTLELATIKQKHLGDAKASLAKYRGVMFKAPRTIAEANTSISSAETVIETDRYNTDLFMPYVKKAKQDAAFAVAVLETMSEKNVSEKVAIEIEKTKARNVSLNRQLEVTQEALIETADAVGTEARDLAGKLADTRSRIGQLKAEAQLAKALEASRKEFSPSEAEAFIQDGKLVVRMKQLNFPSGKSDIPPTALPSLSKVRNVIKELNSQEIVVQGHTDSIGKKAFNRDLSEQRADAIATYFHGNIDGLEVKTMGLGEEEPIAKNDTSAGRAQNRRVDVIITPSQFE